jgi:exosome complex exonuclease RRP6
MDPQPQDLKSFQDPIQAALISTTRISGQISSEDLGFQRSLNPEVSTTLDEQSSRLLALSSALLNSATSISKLKAPVLEEAEDVDNNWRNVVDVLDSLLEKADTSLDEYSGLIKRQDVPEAEQVEEAFIFRNDQLFNNFAGLFKTKKVNIWVRKRISYPEPC